VKNQDILFIEKLAANTWRPEVEQALDGWRLRYTQGITRRGNSVLPIESGGNIPLEKKLIEAETFFTSWGLPACFQMTKAAQPSGLASTLAAHGYQDTYHTQVQTAGLETVLEKTKSASPFKPLNKDIFFEDWFDLYVQTSGYDEHSMAMRREILTRVEPLANFMLLSSGDNPVAVGLGVVERGWIGIYCMVTHEDYRRKGAATQVLNELAKWGEQQNASQMYLQVMENNPDGLALYAKAGFKFAYQYWYSYHGEKQ
jgi:GNAT superfamily N-acetyltransferase